MPVRQHFADDPSRFERFSVRFDDLLVDYSKQRVTGETMTLLDAAAQRSCEGPVDHGTADLGDAYRLVVDGGGRSADRDRRVSKAASPRVPASPGYP